MSNIGEIFGTNEELESGAGVTIDYPGFSVTVHRAGGSNEKFKEVIAKKTKPHQQLLSRGLLDNDVSERILMETYAETVVVGWENVTDAKGKKIPYSPENVVKQFKAYPEFYKDIRTFAEKASNFRDAQEEAAEKN